VLCLNYAEVYQLPVIHLIDKALANCSATVKMFDVKSIRINRGEMLKENELKKMIAEGEKYKRFRFTESGISKRVLLGTEGGVFWNTGDEHDEYGHICENPAIRTAMMDKRMKKLETAERAIPEQEKTKFFGEEDADVTVVSWGSNKGAILDAIDRLKQEQYLVNFLQVRLINPFPREHIADLLSRAKKKVDVESNYSGQLAGLISEHCKVEMDHYILKYNGRPMISDEVYDSIKKILLNQAPKRMVLTHGV